MIPNIEDLKYYFHDIIEEEMLNLVIYEVKIMEYCYNYFANNHQIFISKEVKEEDFKKLKELCYDLIEIVGYFGVLNEQFKVVSHPCYENLSQYYGNLSHEDVDLYFQLFEKLRNSAYLFNEKYANLHEFVRNNIIKNVHLIGFEGKSYIPKIDHFKEELGEDFYERTFKIIDKNLCEEHLEKGKQRAYIYQEKTLNFKDC